MVAIAFAGIIGGAAVIAVPVLWVRRRRAEMDAKGMSIDWEAMDLERVDEKRRIRLESLGLWPEGEARSARRRADQRCPAGEGAPRWHRGASVDLRTQHAPPSPLRSR